MQPPRPQHRPGAGAPPDGATASPSRPAAEGEAVALARFHAEIDLVELNARQVARRIGPAPATIDDLRSFGREGLLQASRSFDPSRGVPFRRWANTRVRGAMLDGVRRWGALPRRVYRELREIASADRLQETYDEESAAAPPASREAADDRLTAHLAGLATAMALGGARGAGDRPEHDAADAGATPEEVVLRGELFDRVRRIVAGLPDAERTLVERHYFADETLDQASASLGLSKSWGSRLHARAIDAIARELRKAGIKGPTP